MALDNDQEQLIAEAFRSLNLRALDPSEPADRERYYSIYDREDLRDLDPVASLRQTINWTEGGSASLFSGYRGTGKSTELLRLKRCLEEEDHAIVVYCDMHDFVNMDAPPDVPDLLLTTAGAFAAEVERDDALRGALQTPYWERLVGFLRSAKVEVEELNVGGTPSGVGMGVKLALKSSPSFQKRLQEKLSGVVGALAREVRDYYDDAVQQLHEIHGDKPVVVIFDSLEHIKGTGESAREVAAHLVATFNRSDHLRIPGVHVVYTVPPWLKVRAPQVVQAYDDALLLPCVKVAEAHPHEPFSPGLDAMQEVVSRRFDWKRVLTREQLDRVSLVSGGQFRDLFRILQGVLRTCSRHGTLGATDAMVDWAISDVRNSYLPLALSDARWLHRINRSGEAHLPEMDDLAELARFFDSHLVLTYRNGNEWYRAHPLIAEEAERLAGESEAGEGA